MKNSAFIKDIFREIKKTKGQFFSILLMIAIASLIYFGITISSPSLKKTAKDLMLASNFSDMDLVAIHGFTEEDLKKVDQIKGVTQREDFFRADIRDEKANSIRLENQGQVLNQVQALKGRLVEKPGEIVLDWEAEDLGYQLGDWVEFSEEKNSSDFSDYPLARQRFKLVGFIDTLDYVIVDQKGYSTEEGGTIKLLGRIHKDDFAKEKVSRIALAFEGLEGLTIADEEYDEKIRPYEDQVKDLFKNYSASHYEEIQIELKDEIAQAEKDIDQAKKDIQEAEEKIAEAKEELADARKKYEEGQLEYEREIAQAEKKLRDNQEKLRQAQEQLATGQRQLDQAQRQLDQGEEEYQEGLALFQDKTIELADGEEKLTQAEEQLEEKLLEWQEGQDLFQEGQQALAQGQAQIQEAQASLTEKTAELQAGQGQLNQARQQLQTAAQDLQRAEDQLAQAQAQVQAYDQGLQEAQTGLAQIQAGLAQIEEEKAKAQGAIEEINTQLPVLEANKQKLDQVISDLKEKIANLPANTPNYDEVKAGLQAQLKELEKTQSDLVTNIEAMEAGRAQAQAGLVQLAQEQAKLEDQQAAVNQVLAELEAKEPQIDQARAQIQAGQEEIQAGKEELAAGQARLAREEEKLAAGRDQLNQARDQLAQEKNKLEEGQQELAEKEASLLEAKDQLDQAQASLAQEKSKLQAGKKELGQAEKDLALAAKDLEAGRQDYEKALKDWKKGRADFLAGQQKLAEGWQSLAIERDKGQRELDQAKKEIEEGGQELQDKEKEFIQEKDQALVEISDGEKSIEDLRDFKSKLPQPLLEINSQRNSAQMGSFLESVSRLPIIATIFPFLFFVIALMVSLTTMTRRIEANRNQLGIMRALGYQSHQIALKYFIYSSVATLLGAILGIFIGYWVIGPTIIKAYLSSSTITDYQLVFSWKSALFVILLTFTMTSLVSILLTSKSLRERPAYLLRPKAPKAGSRIFLERISFLWKKMNFNQKVTARNLFRYKRRAFMTILGIGGCAALLFLGFGIKDSIQVVGPRQYGEIFRFQYIVNYNEKDHSEERQSYENLLAQTSIKKHHSLRLDQGTVLNPKNMDQPLLVLSTDDEEGFRELVLLESRKKKEKLSLDQAVLTEKLAEVFDLEVGDQLSFETATGQQVSVEIGGIAENYSQHFLYLSDQVYESAFHKKYVENADLIQSQDEQVINQMKDLDFVFSVLDVSEFNSFLDEVSGALNVLVLVIIICSIALAFVVLYNLNTINIQERQRELSTIKVLGFYDKEVTAYIYRETILLSVLGIFAGFFIGRWMHLIVLKRLMPDGLMLYPGVFTKTFIYTFTILMAFLFFVMKIIHDRLKRINMVEALKEE